MDLGLAAKTVVVIGGASNIGKGIVLEFAREGSHVILADIDRPQSDKVAAQAQGLPGDVTPFYADVTQLDQVEAMITEATKRFGGVDVLVNSLGRDWNMLFLETTPDLWERIIDLNYRYVLNTVKTVL